MATKRTEDTAAPPDGTPIRYLSADQILALSDRVFEDVWVPEWNTFVRLRSMTGVERDRIEASMVDDRQGKRTLKLQNVRARMVAASAVNPETGQLLFTAEQVVELGRKNVSALQRLFNVCQKLSGMTDEDVEELTAELGNDPSDDSGSN